MALNPSDSSSFEQLALKGLTWLQLDLVYQYWTLIGKIAFTMTYNVSSGTLNPTMTSDDEYLSTCVLSTYT